MHFSTHEKFMLLKSALGNLGMLVGGRRCDPALIVWLLTYTCNLACRHCSYWQKAAPIDSALLMQVAEKIAASRTPIVVLSGGEPLIVPRLREIITCLKQAGKVVSVNTNGLLLGEYADFLISTGVDVVSVSMDGPNAEVHDAIRCRKGLFAACVKNMELIRRTRKDKPRIAVRGVIMRSNLSSTPEYIRRFQDVADDINFQPVHDDATKHDVVERSVLFTPDQRRDVERLVARLAQQHPFLDNGYFKKFPQFLFDPGSMRRGAINHCLPTLFFSMGIFPDGTCFTCSEHIGNMFQDEISAIWSGHQRRAFLKQAAASGACTHPCWLNSQVIASPLPGRVLRLLINKRW